MSSRLALDRTNAASASAYPASRGACPHCPGETQASRPKTSITATIPIQAGLNTCLPFSRTANFRPTPTRPATNHSQGAVALSRMDRDKDVISADFH